MAGLKRPQAFILTQCRTDNLEQFQDTLVQTVHDNAVACTQPFRHVMVLMVIRLAFSRTNLHKFFRQRYYFYVEKHVIKDHGDSKYKDEGLHLNLAVCNFLIKDDAKITLTIVVYSGYRHTDNRTREFLLQ
jgi:hypothetical protein